MTKFLRMTNNVEAEGKDTARATEARVRAESAALRKELGLGDLVLTQILFIVGLAWIGVAGKLGPSHVVFWLLAMLLFYVPSAVAVIYLNRLMPLEGGLYQWAKLGFNEIVGFMLAVRTRDGTGFGGDRGNARHSLGAGECQLHRDHGFRWWRGGIACCHHGSRSCTSATRLPSARFSWSVLSRC